MSDVSGSTIRSVVRVIEDDDDVRRFICETFSRNNIETRCYTSAEGFLTKDDVSTPGCILVDVKMPGLSGIELQQRLIELGVELPMLFLSGFGSVSMAAQAMRLGALDFMEKPIKPELLLKRVLEAFEVDGQWRASRSERSQAEKALGKLSPREFEVLELLVKGHPVKRVAQHLQLSHKTVQVHRANIMAKTSIDNLADLVRLMQAYKADNTEAASLHIRSEDVID